MTAVGLDAGTGGVRAVMLDDDGGLVRRVSRPLPPGRREEGGGHRLDEAAILDTAAGVLEEICRVTGRRPAAVAVSSTAGTLFLRDAAGRPTGDPVAYDDSRHGAGVDRVRAWCEAVAGTARVVPAADAVLESLGAEAGGTDWTNALKLGWDPVSLSWPAVAADLEGAGVLPRPVPSGTACGEARAPEAARGALLVRGATDGCAVQVAVGVRPGDWTISLGTTIAWRTVLTEPGTAAPPGAYHHRVGQDVWLLGAASNAGGGVLTALEPGEDLGELDRRAILPSGVAAYPLARPGERFPVVDAGFTGFGLPPAGDPRRHAAILEGTGYVIRLGIEQLAGGGMPEVGGFQVTGGAARSATWMSVLASILRRRLQGAPEVDAALGAALLALAAHHRRPAGSVSPLATALGPVRRYEVDAGLRAAYAAGYGAFLDELRRVGDAGDAPDDDPAP